MQANGPMNLDICNRSVLNFSPHQKAQLILTMIGVLGEFLELRSNCSLSIERLKKNALLMIDDKHRD